MAENDTSWGNDPSPLKLRRTAPSPLKLHRTGPASLRLAEPRRSFKNWTQTPLRSGELRRGKSDAYIHRLKTYKFNKKNLKQSVKICLPCEIWNLFLWGVHSTGAGDAKVGVLRWAGARSATGTGAAGPAAGAGSAAHITGSTDGIKLKEL
jgi:hypothetical protein